ncbi:MAG: hypothetical protein IJD88_00710 [Clostridia bacterium]|nr:hypothetical protein [Clostridia bacterium]
MLYKTQKYYDFLDYFEFDDCPICRMHKNWLDEFIDAFLYECVNDRKMRKRIMETGGFCPSHARAMLAQGDPLAHSIIYSVLIDDYLEKPNAKKKDGCLICDLEKDAIVRILKAFLDFFEESEEFVNKFSEKGCCICRPHLKALKTMTRNKELINKLDVIQEDNLKTANIHLKEIIRKHDYRYKGEQLNEEEKRAWKRAVHLMAGI